jgi:hypothetical protein
MTCNDVIGGLSVVAAMLARLPWKQIIGGGALAAAVASAFGAWWSARATRKAAEAQILHDLFVRYSAPQMSDAMRVLRQWHQDHPDRLAEDWNRGMHQFDPTARGADEARRMVTSYFLDADGLRQAGLISRATFRAAVSKSGFAVLLHVCVPLERVLKPNVNLAFVERAKALCPPDLHELLSHMREAGGEAPSMPERAGAPESSTGSAPREH